MDGASYFPLNTEKGGDFAQLMQFTQRDNPDDCGPGLPLDIRGWTARMQIKETVESVGVIHELTETDGIEIENDDQGYFVISLPNAKTSVMVLPSYVHDLQFTDLTGIVIPLVYGPITHRLR